MKRIFALTLFALWATTSAHAQITNGLTFWVKADVGVQLNGSGFVTNWINQAPGGGNDARQTIASQQPILVSNVLNLLPVVRFDSTDLLRTATPVQTNQTFTMFAVAPMGTTSLGGNGYVGPFHNGIDSATGYGFRRQAFGFYGLAYPNVAFVNFGPTNHMGFQVQEGMRTTTGTNFYFYNGAQSGPGVASGNPIVPTGNSQVGGSDFGFFNNDVAEVLVYNRALTAAERSSVEEYLFVKWSIPEPSTLALLGLGAMLLRCRRNR